MLFLRLDVLERNANVCAVHRLGSYAISHAWQWINELVHIEVQVLNIFSAWSETGKTLEFMSGQDMALIDAYAIRIRTVFVTIEKLLIKALERTHLNQAKSLSLNEIQGSRSINYCLGTANVRPLHLRPVVYTSNDKMVEKRQRKIKLTNMNFGLRSYQIPSVAIVRLKIGIRTNLGATLGLQKVLKQHGTLL